MSQTTPAHVLVEQTGHVVEITLNRPDAYNSFDRQMHHALQAAFDQASKAPDVRAIVFAARGKAFSAGGDFDEILHDQTDHVQRNAMRDQAKPLLLAIADSRVPVVTALQGDAVGLGASLILASDAVFASRTAKISDPHVVIGLAAGDGGCIGWPLHTGLLRAKRYLLSGDRIAAEDAHAMGLVTDLVDTPEETLTAARAYAKRLAGLPPMAVQNTKKALNLLFRKQVEAVFDYGMLLEMETFTTSDVAEAIGAFREKRAPVYTGS